MPFHHLRHRTLKVERRPTLRPDQHSSRQRKAETESIVTSSAKTSKQSRGKRRQKEGGGRKEEAGGRGKKRSQRNDPVPRTFFPWPRRSTAFQRASTVRNGRPSAGHGLFDFLSLLAAFLRTSSSLSASRGYVSLWPQQIRAPAASDICSPDGSIPTHRSLLAAGRNKTAPEPPSSRNDKTQKKTRRTRAKPTMETSLTE